MILRQVPSIANGLRIMTYTRSGTGGQATKFGMDFVSCLTTEQKTFLSRVVEVGGLGGNDIQRRCANYMMRGLSENKAMGKIIT